jgi:hypothetical protein
MKKAICLLLLLGIFLGGSGLQAWADNNKPEGITSESPMSLQGENPPMVKDLLLLAKQSKCDQYPNKTSCLNHVGCCWESTNSKKGGCYTCQ